MNQIITWMPLRIIHSSKALTFLSSISNKLHSNHRMWFAVHKNNTCSSIYPHKWKARIWLISFYAMISRVASHHLTLRLSKQHPLPEKTFQILLEFTKNHPNHKLSLEDHVQMYSSLFLLKLPQLILIQAFQLQTLRVSIRARPRATALSKEELLNRKLPLAMTSSFYQEL